VTHNRIIGGKIIATELAAGLAQQGQIIAQQLDETFAFCTEAVLLRTDTSLQH
jgi:hypothetical protein